MRRRSRGGRVLAGARRFAFAAALLGGLAGEVWAKTLFVASYGVDGATCGASSSPCRSLSRAIQNAAENDRIVVGPGRYGDLNRDGMFDEAAGEEAAEDATGCACMVKIDKPLAIESRAGAAQTVLDAGGVSERVVRVQASGVTFGRRAKGFTLTGGADFGLVLDAGTAGAEVGGNLATGANLEAFSIAGSGHSVAINLAHANDGEGFVVSGPGHVLKGNVASGNADNGFRLAFDSEGANLMGNAAVANGVGFRITGAGHSLSGNAAIGNEAEGFRIFETGHVLSGNAAVDNAGIGIRLEPAAEASARRSSLHGNDLAGNCGLQNETGGTVDATRSFWGAAGGPGDDPADEVCDVGSTTLVDPPARKEIVAKARSLF